MLALETEIHISHLYISQTRECLGKSLSEQRGESAELSQELRVTRQVFVRSAWRHVLSSAAQSLLLEM